MAFTFNSTTSTLNIPGVGGHDIGNDADSLPKHDPSDTEMTPQKAIIITIMTTSNVFMLLGNGFSIFIILKSPSLRRHTYYWLVLNLAVLDLMNSLFVVPINIVWEFYGYWPFSQVLCDMEIFCDLGFSTVAAYSTVLLSLDKYLYINKPFFYHSYIGPKSTVASICANWVFWMTYSAASVFGGLARSTKEYKYVTFTLDKCNFVLRHAYAITSFVVVFFIPLVILVFTSSRILIVARQHIRKIHTNHRLSQSVMSRVASHNSLLAQKLCNGSPAPNTASSSLPSDKTTSIEKKQNSNSHLEVPVLELVTAAQRKLQPLAQKQNSSTQSSLQTTDLSTLNSDKKAPEPTKYEKISEQTISAAQSQTDEVLELTEKKSGELTPASTVNSDTQVCKTQGKSSAESNETPKLSPTCKCITFTVTSEDSTSETDVLVLPVAKIEISSCGKQESLAPADETKEECRLNGVNYKSNHLTVPNTNPAKNLDTNDLTKRQTSVPNSENNPHHLLAVPPIRKVASNNLLSTTATTSAESKRKLKPLTFSAPTPLSDGKLHCSFSHDSKGNKKKSPSKNLLRAFGTVILVIGIYIIMFAPYWIASVVNLGCLCISPGIFEDYLAVFYYMHSLVNPYIYMATDRRYKKAIKHMLMRSTCWKRITRTRTTSSIHITSSNNN